MRRVWNSLLCILVFLSSAMALTFAATLSGDTTAVSTFDFLRQVYTVLETMGGLSTVAKISALVTLTIASTKVGILRTALWAKLGSAQTLVAPGLALAAGLAGLGAGGQPITPALVAIYLLAGGGSVFLHELLDAAKGIPGLGAVYTNTISWIDSALGGQPAPAPVAVKSQDPGSSSR